MEEESHRNKSFDATQERHIAPPKCESEEERAITKIETSHPCRYPKSEWRRNLTETNVLIQPKIANQV